MAKIVKAADKGIAGFEKIFIDDPRRAIVIGVFIVAVILIVAVFGKKIVAWIKAQIGKRSDGTDLSQYEAETGEYPTLSLVQFKDISNKIYGACKGFGTDEDEIYQQFGRLNKTADILKLIQVFGTKDGKDLDAWMRSELTNREIKKLNEILSNKHIVYSF